MIAADSRTEAQSDGLTSPIRAVEAELACVDLEILESIPAELGLISEASRSILRNGGKRLRPALVLLTARAFSGVSKRAITVAGALEMVHGASLLHDDVIDNSQKRRGRATIGAWWSNKLSVMLGDYLYTRSLLEMCGDENRILVTLLSEATGRMVLGQLREMEEQNNFDITVDDYLFVIREKTAVLMSAAARMGAIVGSACNQSIEAMADFGMQLGMAFQIVDDVLDFWGNEEQLGKPVGSDLRERKFTLPFIYTLQTMDGGAKTIRMILDDAKGKLTRGSVRKIMSIMDAAGARHHAMQIAQEYGRQAREALLAARPWHGAEELHMLVDYVLGRRA